MRGRLVAVVGFVSAFAAVACGGSEPTASSPKKATAATLPAGFAQITKMCALVTSCAHPYDPPQLRDPSACSDELLLRAGENPATACLTKAKSCVDVERCIHGDADASAATYCAAHPNVMSACDGTRFVTCIDPAEDSTVVDCATLGGTCSESKLEGGLLVRGCVSPSLCPAGAAETRCEGDKAIIGCRDGIAERTACKPGERCGMHRDPDGDQVAACVLPSETRCMGEGKAECDGDKLVECVAAGHFGRMRSSDCAARGMHCVARGQSAACVASDPPACAPFAPKCDGNLLEFCAEGVVAKVACAEIGMGTCDPSAHGPEAACRRSP
ncbi:MAG TPA: hypothetical protein VF407_08240 [Polyangiaceae bacterium]